MTRCSALAGGCEWVALSVAECLPFLSHDTTYFVGWKWSTGNSQQRTETNNAEMCRQTY